MTFTHRTDLAGDKVTRIRVWNHETLRTMCINNDFYTCGDNEEYSKLFDYVDNHQPTTKSMYIAAKNIAAHSEAQDQNYKEQIEHILFCIEREAIVTYFDFEELPEELDDDYFRYASAIEG